MTTDLSIRLTNVRIVFPKLFEAEKFKPEDKDAYYSASFLLPKNHPDLPALAEKIRAAAVAKWKDKGDAMLQVAKAKDKLPVHDGMMKASKPYGEAYKDMLYVSARNNARTNQAPRVFDKFIDPATGAAKQILGPGEPHAPYSGMYVTVILDLFAYSQGGGEGVGASIRGVQFYADGERLAGGSVASASDFEAIPAPAAASTAAAGAAALFG